MSGGGGGGIGGFVENLLPTAAAIAATVMTDGAAAPMLADTLGVEAGTAAAIGGAGIGGLAGGATSALMGHGFGTGALQGALGGGLAGAGGLFSGADQVLGSGGSLLGGVGSATGSAGGGFGIGTTGNTALTGFDSGLSTGASLGGSSLSPASVSALNGGASTAGGYGLSTGAAEGAGGTLSSLSGAAPTAGSSALSNLSSLAPSAATTGASTGLGSLLTAKNALIAGGGLALLKAMNQQNAKYGVPTNSPYAAVPSNLNYTLAQHTPMNLTASYAAGGPIEPNTLNGGPIKDKLSNISTGDNQMYPQPGLHSNEYANPANTPVPGNVLTAATDTAVDPYTGQQRMASGGIARANLGGYAAGGNPHLLKGPGDGMSDNIPATIANKQPARLADGEFVVPADVVSHLGNGSTDAGAKKLHSMMDNVRKARTGRKSQGKEIKADKFMPKFADGGQVDPIAAAAQNAQMANQGLQNQNTAAIQAAAPAQSTAPAAAPPINAADQMATYRNNMLQQAAPNATNFVNQQYMQQLGRPAESAGLTAWTDLLNSGKMTADQVAQAISQSPEAAKVSQYRSAMGQSQSGGMNETQASSLVNSVYQGNLGRPADPGGAAFWIQKLTSGAISPQNFLAQVQASDEFKNKPAATTASTTTDTSVPAARGGLGATIRKRKAV